MGFRLYKSVGLGKGIRLNLSKTGVGISAGVPGLRYSVHSSGRRSASAGIPGSGMSYRKTTTAGSRVRSRASVSAAPDIQMYPKAGLLAPKDEKLFVKGVTAYMQGDAAAALTSLEEASVRDSGQTHIGEEFFEAMSLIALERYNEAIIPLEEVVASDEEIPDQLMVKYGVDGRMEVQVTELIAAQMPMSSLAAAMMLAELYQRTGDSARAIELLESLGSIDPEPVFALSLAELYDEAERADDVIRVTEGFTNTDDVTASILLYRAAALRVEGLPEGALAALKEALKSRKRDALILRAARYSRGVLYEETRKRAQARKDFERVYAEDSRFLDVAERLGLEDPQAEAALPPPLDPFD